MPFINHSADIEFEMYCGICGSGCCGDTEETTRKHSKTTAFTMTCSTCRDKIEALEEENRKLENENSELKDQIYTLQQEQQKD